MSLKSQIETAKDAVSKALITALQNKDETSVTKLFSCYDTLNKITPQTFNTSNFTITDSTVKTNTYDNIMSIGGVGSAYSNDVISFNGLG